MDALKENEVSIFGPPTPRRNTSGALSCNGKENTPSYKNQNTENEISLQNLSRDEKLQLYDFSDFDEIDSPQTKRSVKKGQYRKNRESKKLSNVSSTLNEKVKKPTVEGMFSNHESSPINTPICGSTPVLRKKITSAVKLQSPFTWKPPAQNKNIKNLLNINNVKENLPYSVQTPKKSVTFAEAHNLSQTPNAEQSFENNEAPIVSTPLTNSIRKACGKKSLFKDTNTRLKDSDMFGFEDYLLISEEILPVPNTPNLEPTLNEPNHPQLTISEIQTLLEKDTSVFDCSLNSTTFLENSTFLMDTSLADCTNPNLEDTSTMDDTAYSVESKSTVPEDVQIVHSRKGSRKFFSPGRRIHSINKRKFFDPEKSEEQLPTSALKKKRIDKFDKRDEEHYDKLADMLNSTFKKVQEFQLAFE